MTAAIFGKKKLTVSPFRKIGPTAKSGLKVGMGPRIKSFIGKIARRLVEGSGEISELRAMLEFLARRHPPSWLRLAELEQERKKHRWEKDAAEYVRRFLETEPGPAEAQVAWQKLFSLYRIEGDAIAGCAAFLKICELTQPPYTELSFMANWVNTDTNWKKLFDVAERKSILIPLIRIMEERIKEATATELSRLSWLYLHAGDDSRAMTLAQEGREEPDNIHCRKLVENLSASTTARRPRRV